MTTDYLDNTVPLVDVVTLDVVTLGGVDVGLCQIVSSGTRLPKPEQLNTACQNKFNSLYFIDVKLR